MMAVNDPWTWGTWGTFAAALVTGWVLRGRDLISLGRNAEKQKAEVQRESDHARNLAQAEMEKISAQTKAELVVNLQQLLAIEASKNSKMGERIAVLESQTKTLKDLYDAQVVKYQDAAEENAKLREEAARIREENNQLKRRLAGAMRKHGHTGDSGHEEISQ